MRAAWNQFLEDVFRARQELNDSPGLLYRGQAVATWPLLPSLCRFEGGMEKERALFSEFERSAKQIMGRRGDDWELLFDMQHHGIPTRLLDWSEALGIAVAFAVLDGLRGGEDAAVFVLDPHGLNLTSGLSDPTRVLSDDSFTYKSVYWENRPFAAIHPIAISPPFLCDRMYAQRGTFTVQGSDPRPLEEQCPEAVRKVTLPVTAGAGAREFMEHANLNKLTMFPDIVGIAGHIRRKAFGTR